MRRRGTFSKRGTLAIALAALDQEFDCPELGAKAFEDVGGVAVVSIEGPLTQKREWFWDNYESIEARCEAAFASSCRAVMLDINSPGGDVAGVFDLARSLRAMAAKAGKQLIAFTDGMAASAAYAIASAASEIYVSSTGYVGSIGVVNALVDVSAADRALGLNFQVLATGERKKDGNPHVAITDDALNEMRAQLSALGDLFFGWVGETRAVGAETLKSFDGGLFFGTHAVKAGLANGVTTKAEILALVASGKKAGATMADEKKSYEDEMRAKLEEDSKSDDEKKASAAKKMLAALAAEEEPAKKVEPDGDEEKKAEEDEKKKDAEAQASAATNPVIAKLIAKTAEQGAQLKAMAAKAEADDRQALYASRKDVPADVLKELDALPLAQAKAIFAKIPGVVVDPAAGERISPTVGAGRGESGSPRQPPAEAKAMREAMGIERTPNKIRREGNAVVFPAMTPDDARAELAARANGGVK